MWLPLLTLFFAAFSQGTAEFVIAGILPEVASGLAVSVPTAGMLVTFYAIGIIVSPLLALLTTRLDRRTLIVLLCAIFTLGHVACALAPSFELLVVARIVCAIVQGTFFGIAFVVATRLVPPERRGSAVALMLGGLTVANVLGVPLGTAIGQALGWRATFWAVGGLSLIATIGAAVFVPRQVGASGSGGSFAAEIRALGRQQVLLSLLIAGLVMVGQYSLFTYIAPLLTEVTGLSDSAVPLMLLLYGLGATVGVFVGGRLADWRLMPSLMAVLLLQIVAYLAIYAFGPSWQAMVAIVFLWGGTNFAFGSPVQSRVLMWANDAPNLASTLIPSAFNIGIAIGAWLGGTVLDAGIGYRQLPWIGIVAIAAALLVALVSQALERRSGATPPMVEPAAN